MRRLAIFLDLDGTIAVNNRPPRETVTAAIRRARGAGHLVFLCTGRAPSYLYPAVETVGFDGIVAGAGGYVRLGGEVVYRRLFTPDQLRRVISLYLENGEPILLEGEENMYAVNSVPAKRAGWPRVHGPEDFEPGGRFAGQGVLKFTADGPGRMVGEAALSPEFVFIDHGRYAEVLPAGVCKAEGMRRVLEAVGIPREDSVAIGDSRNDIDMLRFAGLGIAMGGSPAEVLRAADRVTGTLEEDGVAAALDALTTP